MKSSLELLSKDKAKKELAWREMARRNLYYFTRYMWPDFHATIFHQNYYQILDAFAKQKIKRLIVTIPPQHGKSQGSSKYLPAYIFGIKPDSHIALMSYSATFARKFNRQLQRVIDTQKYANVFPETTLNRSNVTTVTRGWLRNADEFEIVDHGGSFKTVGRGGPITGNPVDLFIFDDLYKDAAEANSPVIRDSVIEMYKAVADTRTHNESQELCVFTRWHENDLIGWFEDNYKVVTVTSIKEAMLYQGQDGVWIKINYEAIKESEQTELDPREIGEPLYPQRHSLSRLRIKQKTLGEMFDAMYQGNPQPKEGLLYSDFQTYDRIPDTFGNGNYTDTADSGDDFLCSVSYLLGKGLIYVTDMVYSQEPMEKTEKSVPLMWERSTTRYSRVESNNGGRYFAVNLARNSPRVRVQWFHQSNNKESRILTNAATVNQCIVFPSDWQERWPLFYRHISKYKKLFSANKYHDGPDVLTGIIEWEIMRKTGKLKRRA